METLIDGMVRINATDLCRWRDRAVARPGTRA
jgi:hypothetical protein